MGLGAWRFGIALPREWEVLISLLILLSLLESSNPDVANLLPKTTLEAVQSLSVWQVYLLGVERILALVMQIGLSFWVYQAVRQKKWIYLVAAYGLHAPI